ncbi:MAG: anthranilate synthase component I family protein [Planctomycetota bacterium]
MTGPRIRELDWTCRPPDVVAAWPEDRPLMMLHSGRGHPRWARWSILASPRSILRIGEAGGDPVGDLERLDSEEPDWRPDGAPPLPFVGGWIGYLSYDLGRHLEPAACHQPVRATVDDRGWPLGEMGWCPDALVYDNLDRRWYGVGDPLSLAAPSPAGAYRVGTPASVMDPDSYLAMVEAAIEYIAAGDIFQANITHRLSAPFEGSTRRLCRRALALSDAWYGAYLELPGGRCLVSLSPELLLEVDAATRRVITRPIKGTRPSAADRGELLDSEKDAAELNMIVDLMRNDLGRVCEYGSVRVPRPRIIETHPTVHHGVAEVTGRLRHGVGLGKLLRAAFPGGSVTGAPKIRAMQIIDELEPVRRGPYCGAIGFVSAGGGAGLNVAIRTMALTGRRRDGAWDHLTGTLDYGVGGGIVADSTPIAEYRESMDKAAILHMVVKGTDLFSPAAATARSDIVPGE